MNKATKISPDTLRDLIASTLHAVKAYELPQICVGLGIQAEALPEDATEANSSKRVYVKRRLAGWSLAQLVELGERVLQERDSEALEDAIAELTAKQRKQLSEITRRDVFKALNPLDELFGDLPLVDTLREIFGEQPFVDGFRFLVPGQGLADQIQQHAIRNNDWSHEILLLECGALTCTQKRFFSLLERLLHPVTRRDNEQAQLASRLNGLLSRDGFAVRATGAESGYTVYGVVPMKDGVSGVMKNLIFASIGEKPELVFRDAVNNDVEITKHANKVLVYDRPLPSSGLLLWKDLRTWWGELRGIDDASSAKDALYLRLWEAVVRSGSPGELAIFKSYYEAYGKLLGDRLPALIPQVYLHFDPFTQRQRGDEKVLARQRMDFLLMLDHGTRVVIEVDGQQHYGAQDLPGVGPYRTRPDLYAEMVREDRRLKLRGYEVFRFGGTEFADVDLEQRSVGAQSRRIVTEFFDALLARYGVISVPPSND